MNPDAIKGYPGEIMQCTERFTYTTYFADTGFWETGQLQSPVQHSKQEKIWTGKVVGVSNMLLLSTGSLSLGVSMIEMPWQMYTRWLVAKAVKNWQCKIRAVAVQDWRTVSESDTELLSKLVM